MGQGYGLQVLAVAVSILGSSISAVQPLMHDGIDSLGAFELKNALSAKFGVQLAATLVMDHPTPHAIAEYLFGGKLHLCSSCSGCCGTVSQGYSAGQLAWIETSCHY